MFDFQKFLLKIYFIRRNEMPSIEALKILEIESILKNLLLKLMRYALFWMSTHVLIKIEKCSL